VQDIWTSFQAAFGLITSLDADLAEIVFLSLKVTSVAVFVSCIIGMPLGAILAVGRFPGRPP